MCAIASHPTAAYARAQLMSFLGGRRKGFGVKADSTVEINAEVIGIMEECQATGKT